MAIIFTDSFDSYAASGDLTKKWQVVQSPWTWVAGAGRFGGGAAQSNGGATGKLLAPQGIITTTSNACGFWFKISAPPAATSVIFGLVDGTGAILADYFQLTTAGQLQIETPFGANATSPMVVTDNVYHWFEWRTDADRRNLYLDNISQFTYSDAHGVTGSTFGFQAPPGVAMTIDDVVYYDSTAGAPTPNASYPISSRQISVLRPVSDGACNFATLSSGSTHFNLVNEASPDTTSYCEDGTSGHQDLFNMSALGYTPASITGVMANVYLQTGVPGTISNQIVCKSGATTTASSSAVTPNTYFNRQVAFNVDPNTGAAWTPAGLAAAQFGYKNP